MRQRALSALIFVPPLLVVLALGEPWFGALIAVFVAVAAWEAGRLLRGAGYAAAPWLVVAGSLAVAADVAAPSWLAGYGDLLIAAVVVAAGIAAFVEMDTKVGFGAWMATAFGAVYVGLLASLVRLGLGAPAVAATAPAGQLGGERGWIGDSPFILLDCSRIRSLGWRPRLAIKEAVLATIKFVSADAGVKAEL